ncbi:MAG: aspartate/glutamate racemase family protein [Proteobacteria bacterium]|nr:aspartate/glutamate racemase family protein [Pseudomonadota bacterium]
MKTIGLLGGMSWESTAVYYRLINEGIKENLGGLHSAKICMVSVDFEEIEELQRSQDWPETARILGDAAKRIEAAGADFLVVCTNTMHKVAPEIEFAVSIPLLHIADATADRILKDGYSKVGLLGTAFTMEQKFYKGRLESVHGIEVLVPGEPDRAIVHRIIYDELCLGEIKSESRADYLRVIDQLFERGAQAVILGCTEIASLVQQVHTSVPLYNTTEIHAAQAVEHALP